MNLSQFNDPRKLAVWMQSGAMPDTRLNGRQQCPKDRAFMKKETLVYRCPKCNGTLSRIK